MALTSRKEIVDVMAYIRGTFQIESYIMARRILFAFSRRVHPLSEWNLKNLESYKCSSELYSFRTNCQRWIRRGIVCNGLICFFAVSNILDKKSEFMHRFRKSMQVRIAFNTPRALSLIYLAVHYSFRLLDALPPLVLYCEVSQHSKIIPLCIPWIYFSIKTLISHR